MKTTGTKSPSPSSAPTAKNVFRLHGVNVLNRKNVDSIARLTALEKRRANHILDERQRRDTMNQLLAELANLVRESESVFGPIQTPSTHSNHSILLSSTTTASTATTNTPLPSEGQDSPARRPPVKSNSITTLRNAIAEIHRLRSFAGLDPVGPYAPPSRSTSRSMSRSTSPISSTSRPTSVEPTHYGQHSSSQYSSPAVEPQCNNIIHNEIAYPLHSYPSCTYDSSFTAPPYSQQTTPIYQPHSPPMSPDTGVEAHTFSGTSPPSTDFTQPETEVPSLPTLFAANSLIALATDQLHPPSQ
ncbi:hypothetical protein BGZ94_004301 [Podila epigama]|nr:hypothetical protein BGZ94_004301 [Podila epigama]